MIRESQLAKLEYGVIDQTMKLAESLSQWIADLASFGYEVEVWAVSGNHSEVRPFRSKPREYADENFERIIMWYMAERLKSDSTVTIHTDCGVRALADVLGYNFMLLHGDVNRGSIVDAARDHINMYGTPIDFFMCGHLHREEEFTCGATNDGSAELISTHNPITCRPMPVLW